MANLKQSIAVQRQIPEHIKTNYPYFVEFVKAYYEFLQQSQERNLEGYRDIDTTLEEFLDRFKSELSEGVPVDLAKDKRMLLRHLREFYLSRGSEASFKFLFKVLFEKDASLFYPSSQILRASDGKWVQENSIFVRVTDPNQQLFIMSGKFVKINTGTRVIEAYISNVVEYKSDIYELSLLNDISNTFITVGSTVYYTDEENAVRYSGTILKSPIKISVYKRGAGFKLGDIFSLKTDLGNGCLVKVTKIDSNGGILAVSVIKFGLDYETRFWSYLVPGKLEGFEYIQPTTLWENGTYDTSNVITNSSRTLITTGTYAGKYRVTVTTSTPHNLSRGSKITVTAASPSTQTKINGTHTILDTPTTTSFRFYMTKVSGDNSEWTSVNTTGIITKPYQEYSGGFREYGYASKQNYLEYDTAITVASGLGREADRYYVDSSYVGDIVNQFYNEQTEKSPDADYAIVQVDIGAVAKYPGYYSAADGFISDQIYIQDGDYYQIYSYVIKVEEEFKKYSSLVKSLLHPTGMKLFAEYDIFNNIEVSFEEPSTSNILQFSDSLENIVDRGYSFNNYLNTISNTGPDFITTLDINGNEQQVPLTVDVSPLTGAAVTNAPSGKSALRPYKPRYSSYTFTQIQGKTASIQEALNPTQPGKGHDVLTDYFLNKNVNPEYTFVTASDIVFQNGTGIITSTTTDLSIFQQFQEITISGAYNFTNNGTYTVSQSNENQLTVDGVISFVGEDPSTASPSYQVTISYRSPFIDYEDASSSGFGYKQYQTTIDGLGNPVARPLSYLGNPISIPIDTVDILHTENKAYTRNVTFAPTLASTNNLWNAEEIDIYNTPTNYKSHSAYYLSLNSSLRYSAPITSYFSNGTNTTILGALSNTSNVEIGDIIRISGASGLPQANLNGTWIITAKTSNTVSFEVQSKFSSGLYSSNIGSAVIWRSNPKFTDSRFGASSGYEYDSYNTSIDSLGNTSSTPSGSANKVYTRSTSFLQDSSSANYQNVDLSATVYAAHSSQHMRMNASPRYVLSINNYQTDGTTTVSANVNSTSNLAVGDIIRITGVGASNGDAKLNLNGTWTISEIVSATSFRFVVFSAIPTTTYSTSLGTAVVWRSNPKLNDGQTLESVGYAYTGYIDQIGTTVTSTSPTAEASTSEIAYSGTVEDPTGTKNVIVYAKVDSAGGSQRVYSGNASTTTTNGYFQITGNTANSTVLPHTSQRLNKVKVDSVSNSEEGRIVLNAYNEEAYWLNGYFNQYEVYTNHYEARASVPDNGLPYDFDNVPS